MKGTFPKYNKNRATGELGVTFVKRIVEKNFGWIFRQTHQEDDFGIDGHLDIINDDDSVTGKSIGVQVKSGESFFKSPSANGWLFRGENKHLNYYLNLNYPVIVILVDLKQEVAYWVKFDINKTSKIKDGWSMIIPKSQKFNLESKSHLRNLPGLEVDYMAQIEFQWQLNNKIKNGGLIILEVSKEEIQNKDVRGFITLRDRLTSSDEMIKKTRGRITLTFSGYENDVREVYQIDEIRNWVQTVVPVFKYWAYFLHMDDELIVNSSGVTALHLCSVDYKIININSTTKGLLIEADEKQTFTLLDNMFVWLNEFCDEFSIDEKINEEQSRKILNLLYTRTFRKISKRDTI